MPKIKYRHLMRGFLCLYRAKRMPDKPALNPQELRSNKNMCRGVATAMGSRCLVGTWHDCCKRVQKMGVVSILSISTNSNVKTFPRP